MGDHLTSKPYTVKTALDELLRKVNQRRAAAHRLEAKREFALVITHLEDAQMRHARGVAFEQGRFHPADLEVDDLVGIAEAEEQGQATKEGSDAESEARG